MTTDLHYRITGDSRSIEGAVDRSSAAMSKMERESRRLEAQQRKLHNAMTTAGRGMFAAGAAIAAGLAVSVRAAIEWESAWAGVLKTVDGSPEQMAALEEEIRGLAGVLPATHTEIAAVAEAAGQLGVQRENVAAFTKTMIDMGEATNLTSDAAATALARFMNIMQTAPDDVDRLASAIVDLGNKGATTEQEITDMALRIAGAGNTVGLSEQQVLGFAAALSNVGIAAEAGGTAISRVFLEIDRSVASGGDQLQVFADTAGMTAAEFQQAYEQDAGAAIASFIAGLGRVQEQGGDVNAILAELGLTEIRVSDALRRLAGSGDNLATSLSTSNSAWAENTALVEEAERRYGTTAAKLAIARNQVNDFAIDLGSALLPVLGEAADKLAAVAGIIGDLPGPIKSALAIVAALAAVVTLAGGAALMAVPKIVAFRQALDLIAASGGRAATAVGAFRATAAFLAGPWGLGIAAAVSVATSAFAAWSISQANAQAAAREYADTLDELTGAITANSRAFVAHKLIESDAVDAANRLGISTSELVDIVLQGEAAMRSLDEALGGTETSYLSSQSAGERLKQLWNEDADALATLQGAVSDVSGQVQAGTEVWHAMESAEGGALATTEELEPATQALAGALDLTAGEANTLTDAANALDQALRALFDATFGVEEAQDAAAQAMRRLVEEAADGATAWQGNSEEALNNRDNLRSLIQADYDVISAMAEAGATSDELSDKTDKLRRRFVRQMEQAGFSEAAIEHYAAAYDGIPSEVSTRISTPGMTRAERNARNLKLAIDRIPQFVPINVSISQAGSLPGIPGGRAPNVAMQHGGEVEGPAGPDRVLMRATRGEIVIRERVAQANRAALLALNATGRWPVGPAAGGGESSTARPSAPVEVGHRGLARTVAQEVGRALDGVRLVIDDRGRGRFEALTADYYRRAG